MKNKYAVISASGALLSSFSGDPSYFAEEIGGNLLIPLDDDITFDDGVIHVYDFQKKKLMSLHKVPHHTFDYEKRRWIDTRTLDDIKVQKWTAIKAQRDQLEFGGFEYNGNFYDSDQVSQGRIMGAALAGVSQTWTLADNTTVDLTAEELKELYAALQTHVASAHERGRIARQNIDVALTVDEIENVQL